MSAAYLVMNLSCYSDVIRSGVMSPLVPGGPNLALQGFGRDCSIP